MMRIQILFAIFGTYCLFLWPLTASDTTIPPLPSCPDKRFEAIVTPGSIDEGDFKLIFREKDSGKILGSHWLFRPAPKLLWSPDGHYAALEHLYARHLVRVDVFEVTESGIRVAELDDYTQNIYGRLGLLHGGRGQSDTLIKWLGNDQLLIQTRGSSGDRENDFGYCYQVQLRIGNSGDPLQGWLESIKKAAPVEAKK